MRKEMKRIGVLLIAVLLLFMAAACGKAENGSETEEADSGSEEITTTESSTSEKETESETESEKISEPSSETEEESTTEEITTEEPETSEEDAERKLLSDTYGEGIFLAKAENGLNIRADKSTASEVIGRLPLHAFGSVTADEGDWLKIKSGGVEGYVSAQYTVRGKDALALALSVLKKAEDGYNEPAEAYKIGEEPTAEPAAPTVAPSESPSGLVVCIDAGHQQHGISEMEPNGPGSTVMKAKLTTGTAGCVTGATEYQVNLDVSLKLQAELQRRGYSVVMIRTTNDCPLSNAERAQVANQSGAGCFIRVHCNSHNDPSIKGIMNYAPSPANPYMNADLVSRSNTLANVMLNTMSAATGARGICVLQDDTMTGINWCQIPVTIVEMGFMSNPDEDRLLSDPNYQQKLAVGMADGVDRFFGR